MKIKSVVFGCGLFLGLVASAAVLSPQTGSCEAKAHAYSGGAAGKVVTLVPEYWPDMERDESNPDPYSPVCYIKVTAARGKSYTAWMTDASEGVSLDGVDPIWGFEGACSAVFMPTEVGGAEYWILDGNDWEPDDDAKVTFYIALSGVYGGGNKATVHFQEGIAFPEGMEQNPRKITPKDTAFPSEDKSLIDGMFYYQISPKAGRKYVFVTGKGTDDIPFDLSLEGVAGSGDLHVYPSLKTDNNASISYVARKEGNYKFAVYTEATNETALTAPFTFSYRMLPTRTMADHIKDAKAIALGETLTVQPGYLNKPSYGAYDEIIDENLYRFSAKKGERFCIQTAGASEKMLLRVYDKSGKTVATGVAFDAANPLDLRCVYEATAAADYYVGLCQQLEDEDAETPSYADVSLTLSSASAQEAGVPDAYDPTDDETAGATPLSPVPASEGDDPVAIDVKDAGYVSHRLASTDWADVFMIGVRKDVTYSIKASQVDESAAHLQFLGAQAFTLSGKTEKTVAATADLTKSALVFKATAHGTCYIRLRTVDADGNAMPGFDYPDYRVHAIAYSTTGAGLGILTVNQLGAPGAQWNLKGESVKYASGASILVAGAKTVQFGKVSGFNAEKASETVTVAPGTTPTVVECYYNDTSDPKDDTPKGAVKLSISNKAKSYPRTLWQRDARDCFTFSAKEGEFYDFTLADLTGNAVFSITNATPDAEGQTVFAERVTSVAHLSLPAVKTPYHLTVYHDDESNALPDGKYSLVCQLAKVGAIKFASAKVSAKKNAGSVKVKVNRTAKDGRVRVRYGTVAGTAKPGERYVAQSGILEWAANDNKAKELVIKLIPDLVGVYAGDTQFQIQLKPIDEGELEDNEYLAQITVDTCTVTLTDPVNKKTDTVEAAYAKKAPKLAKVKTENTPLRAGTFYGVLAEDGCALTNGLPQLASVTLTSKTASKTTKGVTTVTDTLSAKVAVAGKTYTFKNDTKTDPQPWEDAEDGFKQVTLRQIQKVGKVPYTNELTLVVKDGLTTNGTDWVAAGGTAELVMNVPDAKGSGVQEEIRYAGDIYRQNAKIQEYFNVVTNFTGYYTMALVSEGVGAGDGLPDGNGYLAITVDNKGTAKVAGLLADGTKVSLSVTAAALKEDSGSEIGYSMHLPIFVAKSPYCFGGTLRLSAKPGKTLPNKAFEIVVDSTKPLVWNNDNAKLTYYNDEGWRLLCDPCGGWYDTVFNLQAYYLNYAFEVGCADITEFPTELLATGYAINTDVQPNGRPVDLVNDAFSVEKKKMVKAGKLYDLLNSVNPCNVQVKLARATGLVSGSFSLWSQSEDGTKQKEISGIKHNGILILSRDELSPLGEDVAAAGFCQGKVTVLDEVPGSTRTTKRSWTYSLPFNLIAVDQGEVDWWADDWGERPEEE